MTHAPFDTYAVQPGKHMAIDGSNKGNVKPQIIASHSGSALGRFYWRVSQDMPQMDRHQRNNSNGGDELDAPGKGVKVTHRTDSAQQHPLLLE